ncbi:hypothetical protein DB31_0363 [Hyalangium minutum]|uniref:Uncharacterized protein n=1 Tax=Hyalangium minutum TaxID=394096 RepID=A0A085WWN9_9BACT|nr:hypothetical protein DB31_0363 [Hyalangium minutum]
MAAGEAAAGRQSTRHSPRNPPGRSLDSGAIRPAGERHLSAALLWSEPEGGKWPPVGAATARGR